ncbi:hypothetical protein GGE09_001865 [Roseobacter sp. N2S]|nr:hypothetical protein [Roseobacter sp. N2S]
MVLDRLNALLEQAAKITRFLSEQLNGFIPVKAYRFIMKPDLKVISNAMPPLRRIASSFPVCECLIHWNLQSRKMFGC